MEALLRDVRYALRQLRRSPGFSAVAILSLALGMGANTTIFSAAESLLVRQMNVARPNELVRVYRGGHSPLALDQYLHFARGSHSLTDLIAEDPRPMAFASDQASLAAQGAMVSANFFPALGVGAGLGRVFTGQFEDDPGAVVVLSYRFWRAWLGADSTIIGRTARINGQPFTVVGVARAGFASSQMAWQPDFFVPLMQYPALLGVARGSWNSSFYVTARLAPGRTRAQAETELLTLAATLPNAVPEMSQRGAFRVDHARGVTAEMRPAITVGSAFLMLVVGLVLLIACANVANLLLARATNRRREVAIRLALGVSRGRLVRQLLTESAVIALAGGVGAFVIARWTTGFIAGLMPADVPVAFDLSPDVGVALFTIALSIATGLLFGLAPALQATRADVQDALKNGPIARGVGRSRLRSGLLMTQVALATVLLVGATLFLRSLGNARQIDPGFRTDGIVDLAIDLPSAQYGATRGAVYYRTLLERLRALPQVRGATLAALVPLAGSNMEMSVGRAEADPNDRASFRGTYFSVVERDYFATLGIPIARGRPFDATDRLDAAPVVIVNGAFARMLWPNEDGLGRLLRFQGDTQARRVVGIAADVKYNTLGEHNVSFAYLPFEQNYRGEMVLQVRLDQANKASLDRIRQLAQELDPAVPLSVAHAIGDDMRISLLPAQVGAGLLGAFGMLALLLASVGVYGVTAYLVAQRTGEIGIRTALGATPTNILWLVMGGALGTVVPGLLIGLVGGAGLGKLVSSQLYGVGAVDPITFVAAPLVLAGVALLAALVPARRAVGVDPLTALRTE